MLALGYIIGVSNEWVSVRGEACTYLHTHTHKHARVVVEAEASGQAGECRVLPPAGKSSFLASKLSLASCRSVSTYYHQSHVIRPSRID